MPPSDPSSPLPEPPLPDRRVLAVRFTGSASEYFRIWMANLLLTIATLGLYSAWAKVRRLRYLYGSTELDGSAFEYLARPTSILKGRLIAVAFFGLYSIASAISPASGGAMFVIMLGLMPWVIVRSLSFRYRNTAYRNVRFAFEGRYGEAALAYLVMPALSLASLGLLFPYARCRQYRLVFGRARYGTLAVDARAGAGSFYAIYLKLAALTVGAVLFLAIVPSPLDVLLGAPLFVYAYSYLDAHVTNLAYTTVDAGGYRLGSSLRPARLAFLRLTNAMAVIASVGLLIPWATVRMTAYRASCMSLIASGSLDEVGARLAGDEGAAGDEIAEFFDIDIGF